MDEPWFSRIKIRALLSRSSSLHGREKRERSVFPRRPISVNRGLQSWFWNFYWVNVQVLIKHFFALSLLHSEGSGTAQLDRRQGTVLFYS